MTLVRRMKWTYYRTFDGALSGHHDYVEPPEWVEIAQASDVEVAYAWNYGDAQEACVEEWRKRYERHDNGQARVLKDWSVGLHRAAYPDTDALFADALLRGCIPVGRSLPHGGYEVHCPHLYRPVEDAADIDLAMAWKRLPAIRPILESEWTKRFTASDELKSWASDIHAAAFAEVRS